MLEATRVVARDKVDEASMMAWREARQEWAHRTGLEVSECLPPYRSPLLPTLRESIPKGRPYSILLPTSRRTPLLLLAATSKVIGLLKLAWLPVLSNEVVDQGIASRRSGRRVHSSCSSYCTQVNSILCFANSQRIEVGV